MQTNDMALKRKILYDNEEIKGLVETSEIADKQGTVEVPGFSRMFEIIDGVAKFQPVDMVYKIQRDTNTKSFFYNWFKNKEHHDVTVINTDANGAEVNRWLLRNCELPEYSERAYNAAGIEFFGIAVKFTCPTDPVNLDE